MRISLQGSFRALVCILAGLVLTQPVRAGDDTNAANITDGTIWAQYMQQVMGGASTVLPQPGINIRGPMGIYANVRLATALTQAENLACPSLEFRCVYNAELVDQYLTNYFGYLLDNPAVSGLLLETEWQQLQPSDPGPNPLKPNPGSFYFNYLDDAFNAIIAWNKANPSKPPKTLQLGASPGFNSPLNKQGSGWLLNYLSSCDGLFVGSAALTGCGYTTIFFRTENQPISQIPLPMPWNPTYKAYWRAFLLALSQHIASNSDYASSFVSIGVGGPTASSTEIILPNGNGDATTNPNAGPLTLSGVSGSASVNVYQAWNCLLGNNYGVAGNCLAPGYGATSSYINSDRAFVEEWAAAIDMYGEVFSGVTLIVATGNGLPNFPVASNPYLQNAPLAFGPDCGTSSTSTMDCAAETAIVAYFAGPPIGGANAKATAMAGLTARDLTVPTPASGSERVKWLTYNTPDGPSVLWSSVSGSGTGSKALVSRMLGGLQFAQSFYKAPEFEGCEKHTTCTLPTPPREHALLNVLTAFFAGTSVGGAFPGGSSKITVGSATIVDAPLNYLQVWDTDILYARGWHPCTWQQEMTAPAKPGGPPPGCKVEDMSSLTVSGLGSNMTAQQLLNVASYLILTQTAEPVTYPAICCPSPYQPRGAFQGDPVCVKQAQANQVIKDNAAAAAGTTYAINYTDSSFYTGSTFYPSIPNGIVPYGVCFPTTRSLGGNVYRQAYMGDYVCVSAEEANQVRKDNAQFEYRREVFCPAPPNLPQPRRLRP
jgi:hypothetical protein